MGKAVGTSVQPCSCQHEAQDQIYGKGMRLHNISDKDKLAYCTVCAPNKQLTRNTVALDPMPHIGFVGAKGRGPRIGKQPRF